MVKAPYIDATATVHETARIGGSAMIWNWTKVRENVEIGDATNVGQCSYIDIGVTIGSRCKIQNGVSVYAGVTIADDVFVGPNVTFTNDKVPRAHSTDWQISKTTVERGASIGANATIVCGVNLGRHCMVAAGAVVTANVPPFGLVAGCPARLVDWVSVSGRRLGRPPADGPPREELVYDRDLPGGNTE